MGTLMLYSRVSVSERSCDAHTWMLCPTYVCDTCVEVVRRLCMSGRDVPLMYVP